MIDEVIFVLMEDDFKPIKVCLNANEAFAHGSLYVSSFDSNGELLNEYTRDKEIKQGRFIDETDYYIY